MGEVWKEIEEGNGYEVSNTGKIRNKHGYEMSLYVSPTTGYVQVGLYINSKRVCRFLHCLVGASFIPKVANKPLINHKDGVKTNNNVSNLEWADFTDNNRHAVNTGLVDADARAKKGAKAAKKKLSTGIRLIHESGVVSEYDSMRDACKGSGITYKNLRAFLDGAKPSIKTKGYISVCTLEVV